MKPKPCDYDAAAKLENYVRKRYRNQLSNGALSFYLCAMPYLERQGLGLCAPQPLATILKQTQPTQPGQRHRKLFDLARGLRFEGGLADAPMPELKKIVKRWYVMARPHIGTQEFTESWSDFVHAALTPIFKPLTGKFKVESVPLRYMP